MLRLIRAASPSNEAGCWIWSRKVNGGGYPVIERRPGTHSAHRVALEAKMGALLGSQQAHHMCATRRCVNPDHLQPVTHAENIAEMLARKSYVSRIRELEAALAEADPAHPLLQVAPVL